MDGFFELLGIVESDDVAVVVEEITFAVAFVDRAEDPAVAVALAQFQEPFGQGKLGMGGDDAIGDMRQAVVHGLDHTPAGVSQTRIHPQDSHGNSLSPV